ncbi:MAG: FkbM family methyltransferase [Rhizomicrobium sp.]
MIAKALFDRRPHHGSEEFRLRLRGVKNGLARVDVMSRDRSFTAPTSLRLDTSDVPVFERIFINNDYNMRKFKRWDEIVSLYDSICKRAVPLIIDLGANVGLASLYFAKNWPKAHIISVEPSDENYEFLCRNTAGHRNIQPLRAAAASKDSHVTLSNPEMQEWSYFTALADSPATDTVPALSMQSIMNMAPKGQIYEPFIAKIDIEGFEENLFSADTEWVSRFPIIIIELHDFYFAKQGKSAPFLKTVAPLNRDFIYVDENVFSIDNEFRL